MEITLRKWNLDAGLTKSGVHSKIEIANDSKLTGYEESCRDSPVFSGIFTTRAAPTVVLSADLLAGRQ
ncbi:MAG: hypothetical protein AB7G75_37850, partial [Candidatus Binatia bacterium]